MEGFRWVYYVTISRAESDSTEEWLDLISQKVAHVKCECSPTFIIAAMASVRSVGWCLISSSIAVPRLVAVSPGTFIRENHNCQYKELRKYHDYMENGNILCSQLPPPGFSNFKATHLVAELRRYIIGVIESWDRLQIEDLVDDLSPKSLWHRSFFSHHWQACA